MNKTPQRPKNRSARRTIAMVAIAALALTTLSFQQSRPAEALSNFDSQILTLINNHRRSLGLNPLVEYEPLSNAAENWSTNMRNNSGAPCNASGHRHDSGSNIGSQGVPPGTRGWGENIAFACGTPGYSSGISWSYPNMPSNCPRTIDYTSALMIFCQWIDSASHRQAIESRSFTHIGVGSAFRSNGTSRSTFSTTRFATAPVVPTNCAGKAPTVDLNSGDSPTNGNDVILGTSGSDVINGLGGNDIICGLGGNDQISGGPGNDLVYGGGGNDTIRGDDGHDTLHGEGGDDHIDGGEQGDVIGGDGGNDTLQGGGGWDKIYGNAGRDTMHGGTGRDLMYGGHDNDRIFADGGPDFVDGGPGNDSIDGGQGWDTLVGRGGNDQIYGNNGSDTISGSSGNDDLRGGRGADSIFGQGGGDTLVGGGGWDNLGGGSGYDQCDGGYGRDTASMCEALAMVP